MGKMKTMAEEYLSKNVTHVVFPMPPYFNDAQVQAIREAGTISEMSVRIVNEPRAAALAYGLDRMEGEMNLLVLDLGGGTFDATMLIVDNGIFEIVSTSNGDNYLGDNDIDQRVVDYLLKLFQDRTGEDFSNNYRGVEALRREVERAKRRLSSTNQTQIEVRDFFGDEYFIERLTRAKFEELNMDLFLSILKSVEKVLEDAEMTKEDVDKILLVGGSSMIPKIRQLLKEYFEGKELIWDPVRNPDEAVTVGATIRAGDPILTNPMQYSDCGLILDVNPLSLGIETVGGLMTTLIPRNTIIPVKRSLTFTPAFDNQPSVTVKVYEGERLFAEDNHFLGQFDLTGISSAPCGVPEIEVTFEIDANGILQVTAEDKETRNNEKITVTEYHHELTDDQIEKMIQDAEKFSEEEKKIVKRLMARFDLLDPNAYSLKVLDKNRLRDKLSSDDKANIDKAVDNLISLFTNKGNWDAESSNLKELKTRLEEVVNEFLDKRFQKEDSAAHGEKDEL